MGPSKGPIKPNPFRDRLNAAGSPKKDAGHARGSEVDAKYDFDELLAERSPTPRTRSGRTRSEIDRWIVEMERATSAEGTQPETRNVTTTSPGTVDAEVAAAHAAAEKITSMDPTNTQIVNTKATDANHSNAAAVNMDPANAAATPHKPRRTSKIPRASPKPQGGYTKDSNVGAKRWPNSFTSGMKAGLPVPSRQLTTKGYGLADAELTEGKDKGANDHAVNKLAGLHTEAHPITAGCESKPEVDVAAAKEPHAAETLPDGTEIRRLSGRPGGPVLRIAPDAEQVIMGAQDEDLRDLKAPDSTSGVKKEYGTAANSFVDEFPTQSTPKRPFGTTKYGQDMDKMTKITTTKQLTTKSPESPSSSIPRWKPQRSASKKRFASPTQKLTNPFSTVDENEPSPGPSGTAKDNNRLTLSEKPLRQSTLAPQKSGSVKVGDAGESTGKDIHYRLAEAKETQTDAAVVERFKRMDPGRSALDEIRMGSLYEQSARAGLITNPRLAPIVPQESPVPEKDNIDSPKKRTRPSITRDFRGLDVGSKAKVSTGRSVFQNFRGLFGKNKADAAKGASNIPLQQSKPKSSKPPPRPKPPTVGLSTPPPARTPQRSPSPTYYQETEEDRRKAAYEPELDHTQHPAFVGVRNTARPELADTSYVSNLTMELLEAARRESDTEKKEKLIRMGKVLIQAVNNCHDAEKAMLRATQAAQEAEVACAMTKENTTQLAQIAQEWAAVELNRI